MAFIAFPDHGAGGDIERGKERCRPVASAGMRPPPGHAGCHGQDRLLAIQRLDLRFFIHAQYDSPVGRRQVKPRDVVNLVHEQGIGRELEDFSTMRLQPEGRPYPPDCRMGQAGPRRHRANRPVRRIPGRGLEGQLDHLGERVSDLLCNCALVHAS